MNAALLPRWLSVGSRSYTLLRLSKERQEWGRQESRLRQRCICFHTPSSYRQKVSVFGLHLFQKCTFWFSRPLSHTHAVTHLHTHTQLYHHDTPSHMHKKMCWLSIASVVQVFKRFLQTLLLHLCQEKCIFTNWGSTCIINTCTRKSYTAGRDVLALRTASFTSISPLSSSWYCRWG